MRKILIFSTYILILVVSSSVSSRAQDKTKCNAADVLSMASSLKSSGDDKKDMDALIKLSQDISAANIACNGFTWSGKGAVVTDPFNIPKGNYRMKLVLDNTEKPFQGQIEGIGDSKCYESVANDKLVSRLDALSECRATLTVDNNDD